MKKPHVPNPAKRPDQLSKKQLEEVVWNIVEILYPAGDPDYSWSPDELDAIAFVLDRSGLVP